MEATTVRVGCLLKLALVTVALFMLAGCERLPNAAQGRICRSIAPVLEEEGTRIEVLSTSNSASPGGIDVSYLAHAAGEPSRRHLLTCHFRSQLASTDPADLTSIVRDGQPMSGIRLVFLKRFWLGTPEGTAADPAPYLQFGRLPNIGPGLALALQHVISALPLISVYALLAPAYALVYGLMGRINLAFGEFAAIAAYGALIGSMSASGMSSAAMLLISALALGVWAAAIHGFAASRLVFEPLTRATGQQFLIATIGLALALQEYLRLTQGSSQRWAQMVLNQPIGIARSQHFVVTVTPIAAMVTAFAIVIAIAVLIAMQRSHFGRMWRACADDRTAATLVGVNPAAVLAKTLVLASVLAGVAGSIATIFYGGLGYAGGIVLGLKSLIAAVAGGIGSVPGAFLGGILVGGAEALWSAVFPIEYRDLAIYCLLAALLIWRPGGLLGSTDLPLSPKP